MSNCTVTTIPKAPPYKSDWRESALARVVPVEKNLALTRFLDFMRGVLICGLNPPVFMSEATGEDLILARDGQNFVGWYRHLLQEWQHLNPEYFQVVRRVLVG